MNPERLNQVEILTGRPDPGSVTISWETGEEFLKRLEDNPENAGTVKAFRDVGASNPVRLTIEDKENLLLVIDGWGNELGDYGLLPEGVNDLRAALIDDLHDAGLGP